jgi:hypothetical protein
MIFMSSAKNPFDYVDVKPFKEGKALKANVAQKKLEQVEFDFQQALAYFNGNKLEKEKPLIIDTVSDMVDTHEPYKSPEGLEACLLLLKVDLKRGGAYKEMRYYILQLLKEKLTG